MKKSNVFAVIVGTGIFEQFELSNKIVVNTRFGKTSVYKGDYYVLPRHGPKHSLPPHKINYRANILALKKLGVTHIVSTNAVGSIRKYFVPGSIGTAYQFIDMTKLRYPTILNKVAHTDMTEPYSKELNELIKRVANRLGVHVHDKLVYACMEGPRYETQAEIKMLSLLGADVVGMTAVPEVVYSNELNMEYSSILISTNMAAGLQNRLSHEEVVKVMRMVGPKVKIIIDDVSKCLKEK